MARPPRSHLLRSDENTGIRELVVSRIVKVCKGAREWLVERKRLRRPEES
jgi:hypothetical protein